MFNSYPPHNRRTRTHTHHKRLDFAIRPLDQKVVRPDGHTYLIRSTVGWQLCCQWKDGSTSRESLADLKESHPIETAEYALTKGLDHEPAFNWWVPHVLRKRDQMISLVRRRTTRYLKRTHKFGIEIPKTVMPWTARMAIPSGRMLLQRR